MGNITRKVAVCAAGVLAAYAVGSLVELDLRKISPVYNDVTFGVPVFSVLFGAYIASVANKVLPRNHEGTLCSKLYGQRD